MSTNIDESVLLRMGTEGSSKDNNNYGSWTEMVQKLVLPKYGKEFSTLVFTNLASVTIAPVDADFLPQVLGPDPMNPNGPQIILPHGLTNATVAELRIDHYKSINKRRLVVESVEGPKFFAEIRSLLSDNSLAVVESNADYLQAQNSQDFASLWLIIRRTHFTQYRGANPQAVLRERNLLMKSYLTKVQGANQTPEAYFKEFKQTRSKLRSLGEPDPNAANDVQHFLSNLDPVRYSTLLIDLENRVNSGMANVYPVTLALACELAIRWKPILSYVTKASSMESSNTVFITQEKNDYEDIEIKKRLPKNSKKSEFKPPRFSFPKDKRICGCCDKVGHIARYCGYNEIGLSQPTLEDKLKNEEYWKNKKKPKSDEKEAFMLTSAEDSEEDDEEIDYGNVHYAF